MGDEGDPDELLTLAQVAALCGRSVSRIRELARGNPAKGIAGLPHREEPHPTRPDSLPPVYRVRRGDVALYRARTGKRKPTTASPASAEQSGTARNPEMSSLAEQLVVARGSEVAWARRAEEDRERADAAEDQLTTAQQALDAERGARVAAEAQLDALLVAVTQQAEAIARQAEALKAGAEQKALPAGPEPKPRRRWWAWLMGRG